MPELDLAQEARILRRLLWLRHGCDILALYADDGQMWCSRCGIDFKTWTATAIDERFKAMSEARWNKCHHERDEG